MSAQHALVAKQLVLAIDGMDQVEVLRDVPYAGDVTCDIYRPAQRSGLLPVVILVSGYPDAQVAAMLGARPRDIGLATSWGRLVAASGMIGIVYACPEPTQALESLLAFINASGEAHGIDRRRVGLWASSGNGPTAVGAIAAGGITAAAFSNSYLIDLEGPGDIAKGARLFGYANGGAGLKLAALGHTPMLLVRSGQDATPGLNLNLDRYITAALAANHPITIINHPNAPHAFELFDDTDPSRNVLRRVLAFLKTELA